MSERIRRRMRTDRGTVMVSLPLPDDVLEDLKEVAGHLGYTGYLPLLRTYVSEGLRADLARILEKAVADAESH